MVEDDLEQRLRSLLKGEHSSLTIGFNDEHAPNYMTAAEWELDERGGDWVSDTERERALADNTVWSIQWYPQTPVGFHRLKASSLSALLQALQNEVKG